MKTFLLCLVIAAQGASAAPQSPSERVQLFATCAGRFSALAEHQRLVDGPASEEADARRRAFDDLLSAVMPDALDWGMPGEMALNWRLTAKHAQAQLLSKSAFQSDARVAEISRQAADAFLRECDRWVLEL